MSGPLVSCICLTTHPKRASFLPDALRSYRAQTWPSRELVVINDGEPLVSNAPDITVVNLPPIDRKWTIGEKRNVGVRSASKDATWLATWDDDDISLPHRLEAQVTAGTAARADVVLARDMFVADFEMNLLGDCHRERSEPVQPSALIRRSMLVQVGGYSASNYLEDFELIERIRYLGRGQIKIIPADWYVLRRHGSNVTLGFEDVSKYELCAMRSPEVQEQQAQVNALRVGPGGQDVISAGASS